MTFPIASVKGPLGSLIKIWKAGGWVVFEESGGYVEHKATGHRTPIHLIGGKY